MSLRGNRLMHKAKAMQRQGGKQSKIHVCDIPSHLRCHHKRGCTVYCKACLHKVSNGVVYILLSLLTVYLQNLINDY